MDDIAWVREQVRTRVRGAFDDREACVDFADNMLQDVEAADLAASDIVDREIAALEAEMRTWPAETDNDRMERAFAALEASGIVVRQNFTCCGTCGAAEIAYEFDAYRETGLDVRGYAFFHQQGTEGAIDGYGLNFSYGAVDPDAPDGAHEAIGHEVAAALRDDGFKVEWNGRLDMCLMVEIDWKRRWGSPQRFVQQG